MVVLKTKLELGKVWPTMLAKSTVDILKQFYGFAYFIGAIPYMWTPTLQKLQSTKLRWKLWHWRCVCIFSIFYASFMGVRIIQGVQFLETPVFKLVYSVFLFVCWTTVAVFNINTMLYTEELKAFLNFLVCSQPTGKVHLFSQLFSRFLFMIPSLHAYQLIKLCNHCRPPSYQASQSLHKSSCTIPSHI